MPRFIFIIGMTGTGKSTLSREIEQIVVDRGLSIATLSLDHYYLPKSKASGTKNFDVPEALEQPLIRSHIRDLEAGKTIQRPTYDMATSDRVVGGEVEFSSKDVIIVEGIFAGEYINELNKLTPKLKIYIQSPQLFDNFSRKEERDKEERGKSDEHISVSKRNQAGCLFTHIAPHMNSSQIIIDNTWKREEAAEKSLMMLGGKLKSLLSFLSEEVEEKSMLTL